MSNYTGPVGASSPPSGVTPNFENPHDVGRTTNIIWLSIMAAIATVFVGIRVHAKISLHVNNPMLLEDLTHYGEGYHVWEVKKEDYQGFMKWLYGSSLVYCPAAYFTKVTLLLLEARVFSVYALVAQGIHIFSIMLLLCYVPLQILKTAICIPISAFWNPQTPHATCLSQRVIFIADLIVAIVSDVVILLLPIPLLWRLRAPMLKKLKAFALLGAGGIAAATTVYRLYLAISLLSSEDMTADFVIFDLFTLVMHLRRVTSALELVIGITCACLPSFNMLCYERTKRTRTSQD
ncbi:hypothetical protein CCHL11_06361 [Colletotrichum chlorophyti]|uniref:Rhodopsin domain-containing protein n=1 Tax=Colletotrichum chlorophyti TaxID=708187 RepID=A0A1Q8RPZ4_9PEZI|nr:hypothetical protein CCHL11_06361 [Colletotrichum chlorophyti]